MALSEYMKSRKNQNRECNHATCQGRGISVCDRWQTSFKNFLADMGKKPSPKHTIDRIDTNGNYEPINCKWSTASEQNKNRRKFNSNKSKECAG